MKLPDRWIMRIGTLASFSCTSSKAVVTKVSGQPEKTYTAGQMFYEAPGSTHEVSRNGSKTKPARFLAFIFAKKGLPLVTPA